MRISANNIAVKNAALWLRDYLKIPPNQVIFEDFEKYFKCKIESSQDPVLKWWHVDAVRFENDKAATFFVLRWS